MDANTIDPDQAAFLDRKLAGVVGEQPAFAALAVRLVTIGGWQVASVPEVHLEQLLERAEVRAPTEVVVREGEPSRCHTNAGRLHEEDARNRIVTGWAPSEDGLWRQHTWCEIGGAVIETTVPRERYYGFELDDAESASFCIANQ